MPSIETNRQDWDDASLWLQDGEEWSAAWGDTARLWFGTLMPRITAFLPCEHLLEIAGGHERITARLLPECRRYTGIDLAPNCVAHCQRRFAGESAARFLVGDGKTLAGIAPENVDHAILRQWAERARLAELSQELLQWGGSIDSDCITLLQRPAADAPRRDPILWRHPDFHTELSHLRQLAERYRRR